MSFHKGEQSGSSQSTSKGAGSVSGKDRREVSKKIASNSTNRSDGSAETIAASNQGAGEQGPDAADNAAQAGDKVMGAMGTAGAQPQHRGTFGVRG